MDCLQGFSSGEKHHRVKSSPAANLEAAFLSDPGSPIDLQWFCEGAIIFLGGGVSHQSSAFFQPAAFLPLETPPGGRYKALINSHYAIKAGSMGVQIPRLRSKPIPVVCSGRCLVSLHPGSVRFPHDYPFGEYLFQIRGETFQQAPYGIRNLCLLSGWNITKDVQGSRCVNFRSQERKKDDPGRWANPLNKT